MLASHLPQFCCIDLFCGCGGNSWGMLDETHGAPLTPILALDVEPSALATYHWNMPEVAVMEADIRTVTAGMLLERANLRSGELGCLIASPPCQTYSRNYRLPRDNEDYRHTLYSRTLELIADIKPWVVFMENVPEMKTHSNGKHHMDFLHGLDQLGYRTQYWVVDAANYGVPQHRNRLIYLAYRKKMRKTPQRPALTHGDDNHLNPYVTVQEAISDLPYLRAGDNTGWIPFDAMQKDQVSAYAKERRSKHSNWITNHAARELSSTQLARLHAVHEGEGYDSLPANLKPIGGYKASYGRLWRSKPAPTLTAFLAYPGCGRYSHYDQDRTITIREALRLQSFDDDFRVFGELIEQSTQVGNAVPPLLAAAFKNVIVKDLEKYFGVSAAYTITPLRHVWGDRPMIDDARLTETPTVTSDQYPRLRKALRKWGMEHGRDYPWRHSSDPYAVFLAEFLLQKTQVAKAQPAYSELLAAYPSVHELSQAPLEHLTAIFSWLGLSKRTNYLQRAAQQIIDEYGGQIPEGVADLKKLPGVGDYTANAIACFAYEQARPIVDTTIARVLKRLLGFRTHKKAWEDKVAWRIAHEFVDHEQPIAHNYALLDLAATICLPSTPCCWECPVRNWCAYANDLYHTVNLSVPANERTSDFGTQPVPGLAESRAAR